MSTLDWVLLGIISLSAVAALLYLLRHRKGGCCGNCQGCCGCTKH